MPRRISSEIKDQIIARGGSLVRLASPNELSEPLPAPGRRSLEQENVERAQDCYSSLENHERTALKLTEDRKVIGQSGQQIANAVIESPYESGYMPVAGFPTPSREYRSYRENEKSLGWRGNTGNAPPFRIRRFRFEGREF